MRAEDGHVPFYFSPQFLFCYSFNINTAAVSEPVVHWIRKNYVHMSWGGGHNGGLPCIILPPRREQIQQLCNIITIFYIATTSQRRRDEAFPGGGGSSKSRDAEERSVVCQTCQGGCVQSKEMSWASVLPSTAWGACCCCWGGSCCCCCCCGPPGGATLETQAQLNPNVACLMRLKQYNYK